MCVGGVPVLGGVHVCGECACGGRNDACVGGGACVGGAFMGGKFTCMCVGGGGVMHVWRGGGE